MEQVRAIIHGRVQGVYYRATVQTHARQLGLRGFARNLPDGTVEVVAAGREEDLRALIAFLHQGPTLARVSRVEVDERDTRPLGTTFEIQF